MNDRCRTGVLDLIGAGVLIHTARASGTATPNTAILGVCSATPAAVWPAHWTIEQSHWNEAERGSLWGKLHYVSAKQYKMNLLLYIISYLHLLHTKDVTHTHTGKKKPHSPHHTDPQRCRCGSCFSFSHWSWLHIPPIRQNRHTAPRTTI